ncbi:MAG: hypothetical protein SVR94_09500 [Pseudomonadota bacterium]|nr:hypothetical protein [Pseudomonadota bacterium]
MMNTDSHKKIDEELFESDGDLTIYDGMPFTGIGYDPFPNGGDVEYETSYKAGLPHGYKRKWHDSNQLAYEITYINGLKHGKEVHWYSDGEVKSESMFEFGIKVHSKTWDEKGNIIDQFSIDPESSNYKLLMQRRKSAGE